MSDRATRWAALAVTLLILASVWVPPLRPLAALAVVMVLFRGVERDWHDQEQDTD